VQHSGIWRLSACRWSQVQPAAMRSAVRPVSLAWTGRFVNRFDPGTGLWRSTDEAQHWSLVWAHCISLGDTSTLAVDPTNPDRGYVAGRRIWQLDGLTASPRVRALATGKYMSHFAAPGCSLANETAPLVRLTVDAAPTCFGGPR
jgi:hypothetical protein